MKLRSKIRRLVLIRAERASRLSMYIVGGIPKLFQGYAYTIRFKMNGRPNFRSPMS